MSKGTLLQNDTLTCEASLHSDDYRHKTGTIEVGLGLLSHSNSERLGDLLLDVQYVRKRDWLLDSLSKHLDAAAKAFLVDAPAKTKLNPVLLSDNFRRFLMAITPIVALHEAIVDVFQWKHRITSLFATLVCYLALSELSYLPLILVVLFLFLLSAGYIRRSNASQPYDSNPDLVKNLTFIQESMGVASDLSDYWELWHRDVLCWENPRRASACFEQTIRVALPVAVFLMIVNISQLLPVLAAGCILLAHPVVKALAVSAGNSVYESANTLLVRLRKHEGPASVLVLSPIRKAKKDDCIIDKRIFRVYENQRLWIGVWKYLLLPGERGVWSDVNGQDLSKETTPLPEGWEWADIWHIDGEDEGWEYAKDFSKPFHKKKEFFDYVRRRCWVRTALRAAELSSS